MRRFAILLTVTASLTSTAAHAEPLSGSWLAKGSETVVGFQPCGDAVCGVLQSSHRILANPDARDDKNKDERLRSRRLKGLTMLEGLKPVGPSWKGRVYMASNGGTYDVTVKRVDVNTLSATGCAAPFLCQTFTLVRKP